MKSCPGGTSVQCMIEKRWCLRTRTCRRSKRSTNKNIHHIGRVLATTSPLLMPSERIIPWFGGIVKTRTYWRELRQRTIRLCSVVWMTTLQAGKCLFQCFHASNSWPSYLFIISWDEAMVFFICRYFGGSYSWSLPTCYFQELNGCVICWVSTRSETAALHHYCRKTLARDF